MSRKKAMIQYLTFIKLYFVSYTEQKFHSLKNTDVSDYNFNNLLEKLNISVNGLNFVNEILDQIEQTRDTSKDILHMIQRTDYDTRNSNMRDDIIRILILTETEEGIMDVLDTRPTFNYLQN